MELTQKRLKECLHYNEHTGDFTWLDGKNNQVEKGSIAGCDMTIGYRCIGIDGKTYRAHRLAFLYMTGDVPKFCDHVNRIRNDNRWGNLRPATHTENRRNTRINRNNTSGYKGVSYDKSSGGFRTSINVNNKRIHLGVFKCKHNAFCEYVKASRKYYGEFSPV